MPDGALDQTLERVTMGLYCTLVIVMLLGFLPGVRRRALHWLRLQLWLYELGRREVGSDRARNVYRRIMATEVNA